MYGWLYAGTSKLATKVTIGVSGGTAEQDVECAKAAISDFGAKKK